MAIKIQGTTVIDDSKNVLVGNGSESAPSITAVADIDTGIYFPEANVVALTTDGKQRLKADANGVTAVITSSTILNSYVSSLLALCHSNVLEGHAVILENTNAVSILPISIPDGTSVTVGSGSTWNFLSF